MLRDNLCYSSGMAEEEIRLGEYVRRLRKEAKRSLFDVSEDTGISYSYLSRIENDSTVPGPDTIAKIADSLDGDLKRMLEMANNLPRAILDRIAAREEAGEAASLRRTAGSGTEGGWSAGVDDHIVQLALRYGADAVEARSLAVAVVEMLELSSTKRSAVAGLIKSLRQEMNEELEG